MIEITLDDRAIREALGRLARRLSDLRPAMHDLGQALVERTRKGITSGQDWRGRPFAPNRPVTLARKKGARPLINRGDFVDRRLHYRAGRGGVEVGASAVQAAVLQFGAQKGAFGRTKRGSPLPWGDIPPRPYFPIQGRGPEIEEEARRLILDVLSDYLGG